jgi:hypothetical protein
VITQTNASRQARRNTSHLCHHFQFSSGRLRPPTLQSEQHWG